MAPKPQPRVNTTINSLQRDEEVIVNETSNSSSGINNPFTTAPVVPPVEVPQPNYSVNLVSVDQKPD